VQGLENATKKRSIRINTKTAYYLFGILRK